MINSLIKQVGEKIKKILFSRKEVLAIFMNGSVVVETDVEQSDIDFTIIVKNQKNIGDVIDLLRRNFKFIELESEYPYLNLELKFENKKLDISIFSKKTMDDFVNNLYKNKENFLNLQKVVQHKVVEAIAIYDPINLLVKYRKKVNLYPKSIQKQVFSQAMDNLEAIYETWCYEGFRNDFQYIFYLDKALENISLAIYSRNRRFSMLPYKRLHKDIKELKPNLEKEVYTLMKGTSSKENFEGKKVALKKIIDKLKD
jgi:predicted nucleotidyltransferase